MSTSGPALRARVDVSTTAAGRPLDPKIYGHFLESAFFGNIDGGVRDPGSSQAFAEGPLEGCRSDVLEVCRELGLPVLRWPGGNFTSAYWWQDGTGLRSERPRRLELAWGSEEDNQFGTLEFLAWCGAVGAEPYLAHSCRSVEDAVRWVEYTNYHGRTAAAQARRDDGRSEPWGVQIWGLGNETYGPWQMGHRPAAQYVADARQHARFMRMVDPALRFVAVGCPDQEWTEAVVAGLGDEVEWVSLHLYAASEHRVLADRGEFDAVVEQAAFFERTISDYAHRIAAVADRSGLTRVPAIALDEWNIRHLEPASWPEPSTGPDGGVADRPLPTGGLEQRPRRVNRHSPRTLADALFYAGVMHALHRTADLAAPVTMANTVNLVNANGLVNVRPEGLVRTASYHVWDLYQNHFGTRPTASRVEAPARFGAARQSDEHRDPDGRLSTAPASISLLDVSSALDASGSTLTVALINRSADRALAVDLTLDGRDAVPATAEVRQIGAGPLDLFAVNRIGEPEVVELSDPRRTDLDGRDLVLAPHSITLLTLDLRTGQAPPQHPGGSGVVGQHPERALQVDALPTGMIPEPALRAAPAELGTLPGASAGS